MARECKKSRTEVFRDILVNLLILVVTGYVVFLIWKWNWIIAVITAVPIYFVMFWLVCALLVLLWSLTPKNRLKVKTFRALQNFRTNERFVPSPFSSN